MIISKGLFYDSNHKIINSDVYHTTINSLMQFTDKYHLYMISILL